MTEGTFVETSEEFKGLHGGTSKILRAFPLYMLLEERSSKNIRTWLLECFNQLMTSKDLNGILP